MSWLVSRIGVLAAVATLVALMASPASASPETLKRSVSHILMAPLDLALSPVVAGKTIYNNLRDVDDTVGVKIAYPLPGLAWNTGMQIGGAVIREITGLIQLLPGLGLLFFEADLDPMYAPPERGEGLVDIDTPVLYIKFGVDYTTVPF